MGRPYELELQELKGTYEWARNECSLANFTHALSHVSCFPLVITGSGGSLSLAYLAASLHQRHVGQIAKAVTPLEAVSSVASLMRPAVMILSAAGRNPDIVGAFKRVVDLEPARLVVVCSQESSPLVRNAAKYSNVDIVVAPLPSRRDGFLATNSLLSYAVLLARAYSYTSSRGENLPIAFEQLFTPSLSYEEFRIQLEKSCHNLWTRPNLIVLHGVDTQPAAFDLESKFTEAALGPVLLADYRNFAHGRHHWLAKRGPETGLLAFVSNNDRGLAQRTLRLIPDDIPTARIEVPGDATVSAVAAMLATLCIVGAAGQAKGIDPGRPGVPLFGRKIYNLNAFNSKKTLAADSQGLKRKLGPQVLFSLSNGELEVWREALSVFIAKLFAARFGAVVFDYDGTLCDERDRFTGLPKEIVRHLTSLLGIGVKLGIATGRGKSVRRALRESLPQTLWPQVTIGYYNGAEIGLLTDDATPNSSDQVVESLVPLANRLLADSAFEANFECTFRKKQITLVPKTAALHGVAWQTVVELTRKLNLNGVVVLQSSHSIDIIAPGVTKNDLVEFVRKDIRDDVEVLCIGDKGRFPGNDFDLLTQPFSLSVDESSTDPASCWNLTPPGRRGVLGTEYYLKILTEADHGTVRFKLPLS